ncbi:hypothetical protein HK101_002656 [Irineochytrium annulatum]|nr:hypothetical protein HK101_002656 [Irineochytrium annulatum]
MAALRQYHLALYLIGNVRLTEDIFQAYGARKHEYSCVGGDTPNGLNWLFVKHDPKLPHSKERNAHGCSRKFEAGKDVTKGGVFAETGIFVAQCRHEVVRFAAGGSLGVNLCSFLSHIQDLTKGESYNYANTMIRLTSEKDSRKLEVGYDIICLLTTHRDLNNVPTPYISYIPVMHSYVHDTKCQAKLGRGR